jgi:hypothetical protein
MIQSKERRGWPGRARRSATADSNDVILSSQAEAVTEILDHTLSSGRGATRPTKFAE